MDGQKPAVQGAGASPVNHYNMQMPKPFYGENERTFQYQDGLPSLPVPPLSETLQKYLGSTKPHLSDEEFRKTQAIVEQFRNGIGKVLHEKLVEKSKNSRNWIEKWWEDYAYLFLRSPHAPYVNFSGPAPYNETFWPAKEGTQIERGAIAVWFTLKYWELLKREELRVDRGGKRTIWCMDQYRRMFNGCKTPGKDMDKLNDYFKTDSEGGSASHVIVMCKGRMFLFEVLDSDGQLITTPEIKVQLTDIKNRCDSEGCGLGLSSLTGGDRVKWAETREHLMELSPTNKQHLMNIQTAIMCVVLDDRAPVTQSEIASEGLLGDSANRWFDKAMTFIAFRNGTFACNCDHAPHDAMIMVSCTFWSYMGILANEGEWKGPKTPRPLPQPQELVFKVDDQVRHAVYEARSVFQQSEANSEVLTSIFDGYGKDFIRKHKLHPDTFVQVALQYSYFKIHGKFAPTYETASARKFYHARTETVRSCTLESCAWSRAMLDNKTSVGQRMQLLKAAIDKHNDWMSFCQEGMGCDRHLFGLAMVAMEEGIETPELYTDSAYTKSGGGGNFVLSTSFVGYTPVFGGVLPMCAHGYGFFYCIEKDKIKMLCSTWRKDKDTSARVLIDVLKQSLREVAKLVEDAAALPKL